MGEIIMTIVKHPKSRIVIGPNVIPLTQKNKATFRGTDTRFN